LSKSGELRREETCGRILDVDSSKTYIQVQMSECDDENGGKDWILTKVSLIPNILIPYCFIE
jgi:hypothetical protein